MTKTVEAKKNWKGRQIMKFRLRKDAGSHFEKNLDFDPSESEDDDNVREFEFGPGDVVQATRRLDREFPNKFQLIEGDAKRPGVGGGDSGDDEEDPDAGRPVRSVEAARTRQAGRYLEEHELEGKPELQKLARGEKPAKKKVAKISEEHGDPVTSAFKEAEKAGVHVYEKGGHYTIIDAEDDSVIKKGMKTPKRVREALRKLQD